MELQHQVPIQIIAWVDPPRNNCDRCFDCCFTLQNRRKIAVITFLTAITSDACSWPHFGHRSLVNDSYRVGLSCLTLISTAATISLLLPLPAPVEGRYSLEPRQFGFTRATASLFTGLGSLIIYAKTTQEQRELADQIYWGLPALLLLALPEILLRIHVCQRPRV